MPKKVKNFFLCTFIFQLLLFSQNQNVNDAKIYEDTFKRLKIENKLDSIATLAHNLSIKYYKQKDYNNAIKYGKKEVNVGLKTLDSSEYKNALFNLGLFLYRNKQYHKSIIYHQKVVDSFNVDNKSYQSYCEIGRSYSKLGDFHNSISYFEKGLEKPEIFSTKNLVINYRNLSSIYDLGDTGIKDFLKKKFQLLQKIDSLNQISNPKEGDVIRTLIAFGDYYTNDEVFDFDKAKNYFSKGLAKALKINDSSKIVTLSNKLGYIYLYVKNDSCYQYLKRAEKYSPKDNVVLPMTYLNLANYYSSKEKYKTAVEYAHKSLLLALPKNNDPKKHNTSTINLLSQSINKLQAFYSLTSKVKYLLEAYSESSEIQLIELGLKELIALDKLVDIIRLESIDVKSKLFWQQEASKAYMLGIEVCYLLKNYNKAFYFMEKRKALLLLENITESEIKKRANVDIETLEKEEYLKRQIFEIENLISSSIQYNKDSLSSLHNNSKVQLSQFINSLKTKYPDYYKYKKPIIIPSVEDVSKNIASDEAIIEYVLNKNNGFLLIITNKNIELHKLSNVEELNTYTKLFNKNITTPFNTFEQRNNFNSVSNKLYDLLFPVTSELILNDKSKYIIVPDYLLQTIAFESLKIPKSGDYLLECKEISYTYSISFLKENSKIYRNAKKQFIMFAPRTFNPNMKLNKLPGTENELNSIKKHIDGDKILDHLATKDNFLKNFNDYKIIHLATHANGNDSISPWVAFRNNKLFLNELYLNKNQSELVVLSACNSALGEIKEGEGIFSLARGFLYSGTNSVASTLWKVNDKSSSEIIGNFYKNLKNGQSRSEALRNSKLNYLKNNSLSDSSPYYWASFVLIGNHGHMKLSNSISIWYYIIPLFSLIFIFSLIKNKK